MNAQLNHLIARQRSAEQRRASEQAQLAGDVYAGWRKFHDPNPLIPLKARHGRETPRAVLAPQVEHSIGGSR